MGRAERIHAPTFRLVACYQRANASDLVKRVLGKPWSDSLSYLGFSGVAQVQHTRGCCEVRDSLKVPNDDGLLRHKTKVAQTLIARRTTNDDAAPAACGRWFTL